MSVSVNLADALDRIQSERAESRKAGLQDLKHILQVNRRHASQSFSELSESNQVNSGLQNIDDKSYHTIFDILFRAVSAEKSVYVAATKSTAKSLAASRLAAAASTFRITVDAAVEVIRARTVKALLGHITQILPVADEGYCEPLSLEYLKALRAVLQYLPHVEHLSHDQWNDCLDFCLDGVGRNTIDNAALDTSAFDGNSFAKSSAQSFRPSHRLPVRAKDESVELVHCVRCLVEAPNCPLLGKARPLLNCLTAFLGSGASVAQTHRAALQAINCTIRRIQAESNDFMMLLLFRIFPIMRAIWASNKDSTVKDEILISLIYWKSHLQSASMSDYRDDIESEMQATLAMLKRDYFSTNRSNLELEDLALSVKDLPSKDIIPMQSATFRLKRSTAESERNWTILSLIGFFATWLDLRQSQQPRRESSADTALSRKRLKKTTHLSDTIDDLGKASDAVDLVRTLQVLAFMVDQRALEVDQVASLVAAARTYMTHSNSLVSSWAMILVASCSYQATPGNPEQEELWNAVWQLSSRFISSSAITRSACHLMNVMAHSNLVPLSLRLELAGNIISSPRLNGPAAMCDSALHLWSDIANLKAAHEPGKQSAHGFEQMISWLAIEWSPSNFENRQWAYQFSRTVSIRDVVVSLQASVLSQWPIANAAKYPVLGTIGRAWLVRRRLRELLAYLLLKQDQTKSAYSYELEDDHPQDYDRQSRTNSTTVTEDTMLNFLASETEKLSERWHAVVSQKSTSINSDMFYVVFSFALFASLTLASIGVRQPKRAEIVMREVSVLNESIIAFLAQKDTERFAFETAMTVVAPFLPHLDGPRSLTRSNAQQIFKTDLLPRLGNMLTQRSSSRKSAPDVEMLDSLDPDFEETPQAEQYGNRSPSIERNNSDALCSFDAFIASTSAYVVLLSDLIHCWSDDENIFHVSKNFIRYIKRLSPAQLALTRRFLDTLLHSNIRLYATEAEDLLVHAAKLFLIEEEPVGDETPMDCYEWERCEVTLGLCLDILNGSAQLWTDPEPESLAEAAADLYNWFVEVALARQIASCALHTDIADLLFKLLDVSPDYGKSEGNPSIRTTLFRVLEDGEIATQFHISQQISTVFRSFVLNQHDLIFEDIQENLPRDIDKPTGLAIRLWVFAVIGSAWQNLLRVCLYHIFETAGEVPSVSLFAAACITKITKSYQLPNERDLFRLFCSQLLYTWLEPQSSESGPDARPLDSIPYLIFQYESLKALVLDSKSEITGQIVMRGFHAQIRQLEATAGFEITDVLQDNPTCAVAYAIAKDISNTSLPSTPQHEVESRIREMVGKVNYQELTQKHFHSIVGHMFLKTEQESQLEKALQSSTETKAKEAVAELKTMRQISSSTIALPASQQPSFKTKHLAAQLGRLARRVNKSLESMWTPSLVVAVARMIFDDAHPVFGSLHACRVVQRIRILICFAGPAAWQNGYQTEMLIHGLTPFLVNSYSADDAIGVFQYLLQQVQKSFSSNLLFVSGTVLNTFLSLRTFVSLPQDSTTQESSHKATLSKAEALHAWLADYIDLCLKRVQESKLQNPRDRHDPVTLRRILHLARAFGGQGNAEINSVESQLLLYLLVPSTKDVVEPTFIRKCLWSVTRNFSNPPSSETNAAGSDEVALKLADYAWKSCKYSSGSQNYFAWVARLLGQAFATSGELPASISKETRLNKTLKQSTIHTSLSRSKVAILHQLVKSLRRESSEEVGAAEKALHFIIANYQERKEKAALESHLPSNILTTFDRKSHDISQGFWTDSKPQSLETCLRASSSTKFPSWIQNLVTALALQSTQEPIVQVLPPLVTSIPKLASKTFPHALHLLLLETWGTASSPRDLLSREFSQILSTVNESTVSHASAILNAMLYLRTQEQPNEASPLARNMWLEIGYLEAAKAANFAGLSKTALLFAEVYETDMGSSSRRSFASSRTPVPQGLLLDTLSNVDEPDSVYGVNQSPDINSLADRLEIEGFSTESLLLRGAQSDGVAKSTQQRQTTLSTNLLRSLTKLNLNSLSYTLMSAQQISESSKDITERMLMSAMKLRQWDVAVPAANESSIASLYRTYQNVENLYSIQDLKLPINNGIIELFGSIRDSVGRAKAQRSNMRALACLKELDEMTNTKSGRQLSELRATWRGRDTWMSIGDVDDVSQVLSCREAACDILSRNETLRAYLRVSKADVALFETRVNLHSSQVYRQLGYLDGALGNIAYLAELSQQSAVHDLRLDAAIKSETASVFWDRKQTAPSIKILQEVVDNTNFSEQSIDTSKAGLLATLAHRVSEARLEKPNEVVANYLIPALQELKGNAEGPEAGHAFHEYATYAHNQLTNDDNREEFERVEKFRKQRMTEVKDLNNVVKTSKSDKEKQLARSARDKAKKWLDLDTRESERLRKARENFLQQCLHNYLLSLSASDDYDTDAIRFLSVWLAHADDDIANSAVQKYISKVPGRKFAALMNQLASRLQESDSQFQSILSGLVERICVEHPYHGMYQIFAGSKAGSSSDSQALSRRGAASGIAERLRARTSVGKTWDALQKANDLYNRLAKLPSKDLKAGTKVPLQKIAEARRVERDVPKLGVPPITLSIPVRADMDYTETPTVKAFYPEMSIQSGVSAPKVLTCRSSDGRSLKQLFKGGSDDLRQDAIMEQVFAQATSLLQQEKTTRKRALRIRTYNVIPLDATSGAIEFVQPTMPLNEYLVHAHQLYHPKEYRWRTCREKIQEAQDLDLKSRIAVFRDVAARFSPVLRQFFAERFPDPDEWFGRRLAYTRSTAAISVLGHVLGLGDRHCQNILLDTSTGEVVHIDLGVAFEAGRVLPKPELVPFRLTRDIVDGFGILGTEGVFRRCCEFTLDALRRHKDPILTLLNVLRYDPLYSWSVSPLRARKLLEEQENRLAQASAAAAGAQLVVPSTPDVQGDARDLPPAAAAKARRTRASASAAADQLLVGHEPDDNTTVGRAQDQAVGGADQPQRRAREMHNESTGEADRALGVVERKLASALSVTAAVNELIQQATDEANLAVLFHGWAAYA